MLALNIAEGPIVATFHTSTTKSLTLTVFQGILRPMHEKIVGRIAVSDLARRWQMEALGSDAVEIPNGVDVDSFASAARLDGYPRQGKTVLFLGRYDEPRKGMAVLLDALPKVVQRFPDVQLLIVGHGDADQLRGQAGRLAAHLRFLGQVDDAGKASAMRSATSTVRPTPAVRVSALCWSKRWPPALRWWPATSTPSGVCCATVRSGTWCRWTRQTCRPPRWPMD